MAKRYGNVPANRTNNNGSYWANKKKAASAGPAKVYARLTNASPLQAAVFEDIAFGTGHTVVDSKAGTGKTTTGVEGLHYIPKGKSWAFAAFNSKIAEELRQRTAQLVVETGGQVGTCHSFGNRACIPGQADKVKIYKLIESVVGNEPEKSDMITQIKNAVSLSKANLVPVDIGNQCCFGKPLEPGYREKALIQIDAILDKHGVEWEHEYTKLSREIFIELVYGILGLSLKSTDNKDFDDMIAMPLYHNWAVPQFDYVFGDEVQDWNSAMLALIKRMVKPVTGRLIAFGDPEQSLYGFMGADENAIPNIISHMNAKVLRLSITYRCPKSVVAFIHETLDSHLPGLVGFSSAETANEGTVDEMGFNQMLTEAGPGCFILSRTNAPLIGLAMRFMKEGRPVNIQGRDFGKTMLGFVKRSKAKDISSFLDYLGKWRDAEMERLGKKKHANTDLVSDKYECFMALSSGVFTIDELNRKIELMFEDKDDDSIITLSSVHRSKGLERKQVYVLTDTIRLGKGAEEARIAYVAYSRVKHERLILVQGLKNTDEE